MTWTDERARALGAAIRRLRLERGLTQEALAFRAGVTKNQAQLIEAGRGSGRKDVHTPSNPRLSTLSGIAAVLDISVASLLAEAEL